MSCMPAGRLRDRISLQSITGYTKNAEGEKTPTWATYATVWCNMEPEEGTDFSYEKVRVKSPESRVTYMVTIRYNSTVGPKHRFTLGSRTFSIQFVLKADDNGAWQKLRAVEIVT